ncbi:hypothetical protein [Saccharothrix sp.]|uniref:hypothetical protein n=1 Tax=Saccharothrix sp. TaxID=1873460 RepID=UPI0028118DB0|nr:hypothetical protein [Saccharothrix sp.]
MKVLVRVLPALLMLVGCASPSVDYKAVAHGEQATRDRETAARVAGERMAALREAMPGTRWLESSVDHTCGTESSGGLFARKTEHLLCFTVSTQYIGFDTELADEIRAFDAAAAGTGWGASTQPVDTPIWYYREFRGRPEGPRTYDASNLPEVSYTGVGSKLFACGTSNPALTLRQRWLEAGQPLTDHERRTTTEVRSLHPLLFQHKDPLNHEQAKTAALRQHRYLAIVTLTAQCWYDQPEGR